MPLTPEGNFWTTIATDASKGPDCWALAGGDWANG